MNIYFTVVQRDLRLAMRRKAEVLNSVFFFVVVATLFPLAIGPRARHAASHRTRRFVGRRFARDHAGSESHV